MRNLRLPYRHVVHGFLAIDTLQSSELDHTPFERRFAVADNLRVAPFARLRIRRRCNHSSTRSWMILKNFMRRPVVRSASQSSITPMGIGLRGPSEVERNSDRRCDTGNVSVMRAFNQAMTPLRISYSKPAAILIVSASKIVLKKKERTLWSRPIRRIELVLNETSAVWPDVPIMAAA
jgi:hypothetical protein